MKTSAEKAFPESIEVTSSSIRAFYEIVRRAKLSADGLEEAPVSVTIRHSDGSEAGASLEDVLTDRNEATRRVTSVAFLKSTRSGGLNLVVGGSAWTSACVACSVPGESEVPMRVVEDVGREVRNTARWFSILALLHEWLTDRAWIRRAAVGWFVLCAVLVAVGVVREVKRDRAIRDLASSGILDRPLPPDTPQATRDSLQRAKEFLNSNPLRSKAAGAGVPAFTIVSVLLQVLYFVVFAIVWLLYRRVFPKTVFRLGDGEKRAEELRKWQFSITTFLVFGAVASFARSFWS